MAATTSFRPRGARLPILVIALGVVLLAVGIWFVAGRSDGSPVTPAQGIPVAVAVPTRVTELTPVGHGAVTTWKIPVALVGLRSVAIGPDGRVWVTEQNLAEVASLDGNELTRYAVTAISDNAGAFSFGWGPDGALWFTGYPGGSLGRVMPDGRVNLFESRGEAATTLGIAAASDGSIWTTDPNLGAVVRVGADGTVTPVVVSADGGRTQRPGFIVAGRGDQMWFTIPDTSQVATVSTTGDHGITRYTVPGLVTPRDIVAAGDGTCWVTLEDKAALAHVDGSTGHVAVVPLHGAIPTDGLNDLALAQDGTLWITTPSDTVLHVSTSGRVLARVAIAGASYADGITVAPDGAVWVAARDDIIAKITP